MKIVRLRTLIALLLLATPAANAADQAAQPVLVFGAASLTETLRKVSDEYTKVSGAPVKLSFASSAQLAKQIEAGAQADVFVSADQEWMDYLDGKGLIKPGSRSDMLGNRLALIAPRDSEVSIKLGPNAPILAALGPNGRLVTGDPNSVPAGKYAKAALTSLGLWDALAPRLAGAENVRVALSYVARGEAPLGIVYATDAAVEPKVRLVDLFPESSHAPIAYPVAMTRTAQEAAAAYLQFLRSATATGIFSKAGFKIVASPGPMVSGCSEFAFDLSSELALFGVGVSDVAAAASVDKASAIDFSKAYRVTLNDQARVRFAAEPGKVTGADGSHAGILRLPSIDSRTVRVTLNQSAWIDLLSAGKVVDSTRHTGSHDCHLVRKSVEFMVAPGAELVLQLSGSAEKTITLAVTTL